MTLTRWQTPAFWTRPSLRRVSTLRDEIDSLFDTVFDDFLETPAEVAGATQFLSGWLPAIDLYENKDNFIVKAELPGMRKEDIDISLHNSFLTLAGERKQEKKYGEEARVYRSERFPGRFHRTISLPATVNADQIKASYDDGILTVTLPKAEEAKPKQIPIEVK